MKSKLLIVILIFISGILAFGQKVQVTGKVNQSTGEPLPGVNVIEKGTVNGAVTSAEGDYSITVADQNAVLVFSYVGYLTQEIPVKGMTSVNVILEEDMTVMEEVVVIGYGTIKKKDLTGAVSVVSTDGFKNVQSLSVGEAIQGRASGVTVRANGNIGAEPNIKIRGIGNISNTNPLYVVDGLLFTGGIRDLNVNDIESVQILKDASAAAIYGVRAANGVILIETKAGRKNQKSEITYDGYYGMQIAQNVLKMANAEQFTTMAIESGSAADASFILNAMQRYGRSRVNPNVPDVNTDWYDEILRTASIQNHSLSLSGGSENATYSLGVNYFSQEGILDMKNEYQRFNLRSKVDFQATDWLTIGGNMILSNANKYSEEGGAWSQAYYAVPILPVYDEQNTAAWPTAYANAQDIGYRSGQNPFPTLVFNDNKLKIMKMLANFYAKIDIIPQKLSFKTTYNIGYTDVNERHVNLPYFIGNSFQRPDSYVAKAANIYNDQIWDNVLTYTNSFGNHNVVVMAGTSFRDEAYQNLHAQGINFPYEQEESWYISQSEEKPEGAVGDDGLREYGLSYFGRLSYNYNDKYLLYATMRADGSSKYQEKWGYFPTIGAGWVISEESFMKDNDFIDFLKLRASWGQLGNDKIQASDGAITTSVVNTAINGVLVAGTVTKNTFSSLEWEVTEETNVGLTSRILNNRLSIDADYYIRDTKNAAIYVTIPGTGESILKNVGVIRNSGFEVALNWTENISDDFLYNIGVNFSTLKNEVRDLYGQPYIDGGSAEFRQRSIVGEPLLAFFGYEVLGVYQNEAEIAADPSAPADAVPGDFKYRDQQAEGEEGYGVIDDDDRVVLGSYFPTFMYGANVGISWKGFDFTTNVLGQMGNKILNRKRGEVIWTADQNMDADLAINRWHGEGTSNKYPSSAGLRRGWNQKMSDYLVEDGAFFRIQNVQIAYNIRGQKLFGVDMPETKISFTADRPLTLFKYNGFNPEVANGVDNQTYPIPAVYTVGLNIKF